MIEVRLFDYSGSFAENKDVARKIRNDFLMPALEKKDEIILDFAGIDSMTQSFAHALISDALRKFGSSSLDHISFKNCNEVIKKIILVVTEYMQESE